ncbi:ribonuclease H-like domain-containing protein [Tanacetum coccineum]
MGCYSKLNTENLCFVTQLNKNSKPKTFYEAYKFTHWTDDMNDEMDALLRNDTWEITDLPKDRKSIGSKWVFKIKYKSDGEIDRYKTRLVAKGFNQKEGIDYEETFSPVIKIVTVRCLLNLIVLNGWPIFQFDVNNAFLYGDLVETIYMKLPEGYFPAGENKVCRLKKSLYGLKQALRQWNAKLTSALIENGFSQSKYDYFLYTKSDKDLGKLKYFLGIEVVDINKGICLNQRNYILDLLSEYDWEKCVVTRKSVTGYYVFMNGSLVSWKSKKQNTLSKSLTKAEYRDLASVTSEVIWILKILKDLKCENLLPVSLYCDNNSTIKIVVNPIFYERTKHLEIDLHFVRGKILSGIVKTVNLKVDIANQIADILTKGLDTIQHKELVKKLGMFDIY